MKTKFNLMLVIIGVLFVFIMVTAVIFAGQACFVYPYGSPNWPAPSNCVPWSGCTMADEGGRCTGIIRIEIGDLTYTYYVMSCNNATAGTVNRCVDYPETSCQSNGQLTCLTYTVWSNADCLGESATWYIHAPKCRTHY